jgi:hypothetical protein
MAEMGGASATCKSSATSPINVLELKAINGRKKSAVVGWGEKEEGEYK